MGTEDGVELSQRDKFWELYQYNRDWMAENVIDPSSSISPMFEVITPSGETFFIVSCYRRSPVSEHSRMTAKDYLILIAFDANLQPVGFAGNNIKFFSSKRTASVTGVIATQE